MAIADDRKILTDSDISRGRRARVRSRASRQRTTPIDPFDTPSARPVHPMHESGYGHGV